jgi:hypothetical protein
MTIQDFKISGVSKDLNVLGDNTYLDNGQGCGTIWFKNVPEARKFLDSNLLNPWNFDGQDSGLCNCCRCSVSNLDPEYKKREDFMCREWKEDIKQEVRDKRRVI